MRTEGERRIAGQEAGAAAVEFALVVVILLVIVFGIINFGVVFSHQLTLNNAVREGARGAVVNELGPNRTCQGISDNVRNQTASIAFDASKVVVNVSQDGFPANPPSPCPSPSTGGNTPCLGSYNDGTGESGSIVVEAKYPSKLLVAFPPFPNTIDLSAKAVYRCEFSR